MHVLSIVLEVTLIALGVLAAVAILSVVAWIAIRIYRFLARRPRTRPSGESLRVGLRTGKVSFASDQRVCAGSGSGTFEYLWGSGRMAVDPPEGSARQLPARRSSEVVPTPGTVEGSGDYGASGPAGLASGSPSGEPPVRSPLRGPRHFSRLSRRAFGLQASVCGRLAPRHE